MYFCDKNLFSCYLLNFRTIDYLISNILKKSYILKVMNFQNFRDFLEFFGIFSFFYYFDFILINLFLSRADVEGVLVWQRMHVPRGARMCI